MTTKPTRKNLSKRTRFEVFKRDAFTCQYCGAKAPDVVLHVDHVVPLAKGGSHEKNNIVTACETCNAGKSDIELGFSFSIQKSSGDESVVLGCAVKVKTPPTKYIKSNHCRNTGGRYALPAGWLDDFPFYNQEFCGRAAFLWLVENSEWVDQPNANLRAGQLHISITDLAEYWGWGRDRVSRWLSALERLGMISRSGPGRKTITINDFARYGAVPSDDGA